MLSGGGWKHVPGLLRGTIGKPICEPFGSPVREPFGDAKPRADCTNGSAHSIAFIGADHIPFTCADPLAVSISNGSAKFESISGAKCSANRRGLDCDSCERHCSLCV